MKVKCNIITSAISSLAKEIGKSDAYTCNLVSAWQTDMSRGNIIPTKYQLDKYIKENQAKVEELKLAIPCYNYEQENGQSKLVKREGNEITLVHFDDINKLFNKLFNDFKNDQYINGIKESVETPKEAYMFLLWREQSIIQNGYHDDYRDSDKATKDALTKLRLWKKANPNGQQKQAQTSSPKGGNNDQSKFNQQSMNNKTITNWARTSNNSYEVSTRGDKRFSALNATFNKGTTIDGVDVSGKTIEDIYQNVIKKSGKGKAPSKTSRLNLNPTSTSETKREAFKQEVIDKYGKPLNYSTKDGIITLNLAKGTLEIIPFAGSIKDSKGSSLGNKDINYFVGGLKIVEDLAGGYEDFSYTEGYLPLWKEWAKQNPKLIEELREKAKGKTLTDQFASTRVSQARALADILNTQSVSSSNTYTNHSGGALGSDFYWGNIGEKYGVKSNHYYGGGNNNQSQFNQQNQQSMNNNRTITYTPKGKQTQTYTIKGSHIFNKNGKEVFSSDSADRNAIYANLAVKEKRAVIVEHNGHKYVVNKKGKIISVGTRKVMQWDENNGDRKAIAEAAQAKFLEMNKPKSNVLKTFKVDEAQPKVSFYTGNITPSDNTIFVFGSNPEGRHGAGAAKVAVEKFGAKNGVGEGLTGNAYALPTKDLRVTENGGKKSIKPEQIIESIKKMYDVARQNPNKIFKVAYRNTDSASLNGYTGYEMINMFNKAGEAPENVQFSSEWFKTGRLGVDNTDELMPEATNTNEIDNSVAADDSMPEIGTGAESLLKVDTDNPIAKLAMDINPIQRRARVDMLAHQFSEKLDELVQQKTDELSEELNQEMLGERRPNVLHRIKVQAQLYDNAFEGRKAIMSTAGTSAKEIFDMIKKDLEDAVEDTDSYTPEEIKAYQKVIDNFDLLVNETCAKLESTENVRITFSQNNYHNGKSVSKVVSSNVEDTAQKEEDDEEAFSDDDTGKRVEGNAGWSYHARFVNPSTSIARTTKLIIANIPMLDEDGEYMVDDLGYQRYIDENYAHNVLLNELSSLISPEDFVTIDKDRNPIAFPALEKATKKYPWIQQVIDTLYEHNDYISAFYADFRKDHIPYWMQYYGKDSQGNWQWFNKQMNAPMALESTLNEIRSDYEHGYRLDQYSVYSVGNKLEVNNANIGLELLNSNEAGNRGALTVLNDPNFDATDAEDKEIDMVIEKPTQVFRMLGVNVNKNIITALLGTKDSAEQLKTALNAARRIFEDIVKGKVAEGADLITALDEDYKTIAKIVGSVSEIANVGSFRNDDKTYYSYSAPNYMDTMFKKFKSDTRRQDYIDNEFKKYDWFYDKDKEEWNSEWMHILEGNPNDEDFDEECKNIRFNMQMKELKTIKDKTNDPNNRHADYSNWQPMQIKQHFVQEYFSAGRNKNSKIQYAWYNFPIFSDSPVAKFIKFKRYVASKENGSVEDQIIPLLRKVVKQELGRMKLVNQRREKGAEPISNFDDDKHLRGTKFCFFPDFEFYYVKEDGTIYDGFGKTEEEIDPSYTLLKDKLSELYEAKDTSAADALIDAAVKYDMDDLYTKFLQDFGALVTESPYIMLDNSNLTKLGEDTLEDLKKSGAIADSMNFSDALHEYFWNQAYATTQIIEVTTTDLAFYKDAGDFQKRFKELYAAGTKLNTLSKYGKKSYKTIYLVDSIITSPSYNDIKKSLDDAKHAGHITDLDEESILKQLEKINVADAQAYRSLSSIRSVLDMMGQWTPEMETTYNNIRKGDWNMNDLNTIWQTLKPFVYTQIDSSDGIGGRMKVPHQNKNSEFALLYAYVAVATGSSRDGHIQTKTSGKLKAMADFMENNNIDVIQFQSAVKAGNQGDINLNMSHKKLKEWAKKTNWAERKGKTGNVDINVIEEGFREEQTDRLKNGEISQSEFDDIIDSMQLDYDETKKILEKNAFPNGQEDEEVVHTIPYDDYIIQQPTPEHLLDARAVFGSQFRNLVISDLPDDFKIKIRGKDLGKKEILDLYNSLIVENLLDDFDRLKERFENIEKFQEALLQEVNGNPKYGRDMLDALQLVDVKDENGNTHKEFNIPLYNPATTLKIQELVNSMFKNAITKQHVKGGACILVSSFGFTDQLHVLHNSDGSIKGMECYMPAYSKNFFQPFMKVDENGNPYLDPTELPNELRRGIGYRIPTEDKYSMAPLYIKGFLPQENGSEIMLPAETTLFSGEDYDVDKKFLMLPEYKVQPYDMNKARREYLKANNAIDKMGSLFRKGTPIDAVANEDQSFNNWFSNLSNEEKEGYKLDKPIITKIKYDINKKPQEQSRAARNNMIFDLAYSILTNKDTAEKIHNPGSFDKAKREAKMDKIAGNKQLLAIWSKKNHTSNNVEATVDSLLKASLGDMTDFLDKYEKERTQMTVDTFIYNHKQNMTGAALIGMYANNTSMQAKFQQTNIAIKDDFTFSINAKKRKEIAKKKKIETDGRTQSLHDITSLLDERISKNCANFSAASVDNVKDPVLADLRQNTNTANIMGMLLRAGLSIQEASLMFQQPIVAQWIDETDGAKIDNLDKLIESYSQQLVDNGGEVIEKEKVIREHDFTTEELLTNVVKGLDASSDDYTKTLADNIKSAYLFLNAAHIADDLAELTRISRADSPNGAIKPSIAGFFGQLMRVGNYHKKADTDGFTLEGIGDCVKNNKLNGLYNNRNEMRKALLESNMPVLQAFYSLGIESARHYLSPYFTQLTNYMSQVTRRVGNNSGFDNVPDQVLNTLYKDFIYYALTHSKVFGNGIEVNGKSTYEDKRKFYLYEYPKHLMKTIADNPDIAQLTAIKKLEVKDEVIRMTNSGRLTQPARESLQRDFDMLLYMDNKAAQQLAIDLFMYSFYEEGFNFGPNTIGGMFSTLFLDSVPEYVQALRNILKEMPNNEDESTYFDDFLNQFYANRYNMSGVLPIRTVDSSDFTKVGDYIIVPINKVKNWKTQTAYSYVGLKDENGTLLGYYSVHSMNGKNVTYTKLSTINDSVINNKTFNDVKYDANSTTAEIAESLKEEIVLRDKAGMLKTNNDDIWGNIDSMITDAEISPDSTDDTAKAAMNDEAQNQAPAEIKQKANEDADIPSDVFGEIGSLTTDDLYTMEGGQNTLDTKMC